MSFSSDQPLTANQISVSLEVPEYSDPQFQEVLSLYLKRMADASNTKEGALHALFEVATFQQYFLYQESPPAAPYTPNPFNFRNGYRRTYDLVALNAGVPIPVGTTTIVLTGQDLIDQILYPVNGYTAATIAGPIYVFNGTTLEVRFDNTAPAAQALIIINGTGAALDQAVFNIEYLKVA